MSKGMQTFHRKRQTEILEVCVHKAGWRGGQEKWMGLNQTCEQELCAGGWKKDEARTRKKEECVFHQVHLVLHSTGDILREIHTLCFRVPAPKGHHRSALPKNTSIQPRPLLAKECSNLFLKRGRNVPVKTDKWTFFNIFSHIFVQLKAWQSFWYSDVLLQTQTPHSMQSGKRSNHNPSCWGMLRRHTLHDTPSTTRTQTVTTTQLMPAKPKHTAKTHTKHTWMVNG